MYHCYMWYRWKTGPVLSALYACCSASCAPQAAKTGRPTPNLAKFCFTGHPLSPLRLSFRHWRGPNPAQACNFGSLRSYLVPSFPLPLFFFFSSFPLFPRSSFLIPTSHSIFPFFSLSQGWRMPCRHDRTLHTRAHAQMEMLVMCVLV